MTEYPRVPLGELAASDKWAITIGPFGSKMKSELYVSHGVPVVRGANLSAGNEITGDWVFVTEEFANTIPNCITHSGELLFPHRGAIGEVALVKNNHPTMVISSSLMKFRPDKEKADAEFLFYYFSSAEGRQEIMRFSSSVGTPGIGQPLSSLRQFRVPLPDLATQKSIAQTLSILDKKIELNRRMNETLEALAQAIFKDWFVDFGPTRRRQEGATDPVAILGGLIPDPARATQTAALFPNRFSDDGLPEGWRDETLDVVCTVNDESWKASNHPDEVNYVDLSNTKWGVIESTSILQWKDAPSRARRIARIGDSIVGTVRPGNGSFAYITEEGYTVSTGFAVLRPKKAEFASFIYVAATRPENITRLANLADGHGGAYPAVNPSEVTSTIFTFSGEAIIFAFDEIAAPIRAKIEHNKKENRTLAETRDYLLPKLMSGQVRVRDAEKAVL